MHLSRKKKKNKKINLAASHRIPPKPVFYFSAKKGSCRFCGEIIFNDNGEIRTRANWHTKCVTEYKIIYWPAKTALEVKKRDKGICASCGNKTKDWQVDHIKPLIEANGQLEYWLMDNLQTLCIECHKIKTISESKQRALARKLKNQKAET